MRAIAILVAAALWVTAWAAMAETSCEDPEWFKEGNWYAARVSKRGGVEIGIVGEGEAFIPTDTISIHGGMLLEEYYHTVDRPEEFIMVTEGWKDKTPRTYWLLNARTGEVRRLLDVPAWRTLGGVALGCGGARALISAGRSYSPDVPPTDPSVTYLIDVDSGSIIRKWHGLYFESCERWVQPQSHHDRATRMFWIGRAGYRSGSWRAEDDAKQMIRIDCATGDTMWVDERKLFGEDLMSYWISDVYRGRMLVGTRDGLSEEEQEEFRRTMLVDLTELRPLAEWRTPRKARGSRIAEDLNGMVYYLADDNEAVHRWLVRAGEVEPVEVEPAGGRTP